MVLLLFPLCFHLGVPGCIDIFSLTSCWDFLSLCDFFIITCLVRFLQVELTVVSPVFTLPRRNRGSWTVQSFRGPRYESLRFLVPQLFPDLLQRVSGSVDGGRRESSDLSIDHSLSREDETWSPVVCRVTSSLQSTSQFLPPYTPCRSITYHSRGRKNGKKRESCTLPSVCGHRGGRTSVPWLPAKGILCFTWVSPLEDCDWTIPGGSPANSGLLRLPWECVILRDGWGVSKVSLKIVNSEFILVYRGLIVCNFSLWVYCLCLTPLASPFSFTYLVCFWIFFGGESLFHFIT